LSLLIVNLII